MNRLLFTIIPAVIGALGLIAAALIEVDSRRKEGAYQDEVRTLRAAIAASEQREEESRREITEIKREMGDLRERLLASQRESPNEADVHQDTKAEGSSHDPPSRRRIAEPVPAEASAPTGNDRQPPNRTFTAKNFEFALTGCTRTRTTVWCNLTVTNLAPYDQRIHFYLMDGPGIFYSTSRAFDKHGTEHLAVGAG